MTVPPGGGYFSRNTPILVLHWLQIWLQKLYVRAEKTHEAREDTRRATGTSQEPRQEEGTRQEETRQEETRGDKQGRKERRGDAARQGEARRDETGRAP